MKLWCKAMALFLALLWVPVSSHCLLETAELIHHDHCCQPSFGDEHSHGHDAADGNCQVESRQLATQKKDVLQAFALIAVLNTADFSFPERLTLPGLIADGVAPPELGPTWQFVSRAAVSPRAPAALL